MRMRILAILMIFAFTSLAFGENEDQLVRLNGTVEVRHLMESEWSSVYQSRPVLDTDYIQTHESSLARLDFHDSHQSATIYERTIVQVRGVTYEKVSLFQYIGKVEVVVRHLFEKPTPVEVVTPSAVMAVRGSVADCFVLRDGTTHVDAKSGHIDVTALGHTISITGGQSVIVHPGMVPKLIAPPVNVKAPTAPAAAAPAAQSSSNNASAPSTQAPTAAAASPSPAAQPLNAQASAPRAPGNVTVTTGPAASNANYGGPPPGTITKNNPDGTITYSYTPKTGQPQPTEIPPGVVKVANPDGTFTYSYTMTPGHDVGHYQPPSASAPNLGGPPQTNPGSQQPGIVAPSNVPPGVAANGSGMMMGAPSSMPGMPNSGSQNYMPQGGPAVGPGLSGPMTGLPSSTATWGPGSGPSFGPGGPPSSTATLGPDTPGTQPYMPPSGMPMPAAQNYMPPSGMPMPAAQNYMPRPGSIPTPTTMPPTATAVNPIGMAPTIFSGAPPAVTLPQGAMPPGVYVPGAPPTSMNTATYMGPNVIYTGIPTNVPGFPITSGASIALPPDARVSGSILSSSQFGSWQIPSGYSVTGATGALVLKKN